MTIVVLDTNVLASGLATASNPDSVPGEVIRLWRAERFRLVLSAHILAELTRTFRNPYFARYLSESEVAAALVHVQRQVLIQPVTTAVIGVATHPEDDLVLATALSAGATRLVTGDRRLRAVDTYQGVRLVSPREFVDELTDQSRPSGG